MHTRPHFRSSRTDYIYNRIEFNTIRSSNDIDIDMGIHYEPIRYDNVQNLKHQTVDQNIELLNSMINNNENESKKRIRIKTQIIDFYGNVVSTSNDELDSDSSDSETEINLDENVEITKKELQLENVVTFKDLLYQLSSDDVKLYQNSEFIDFIPELPPLKEFCR
ncbi:hypothetical protein WA158_004002 [Blastocystis sp. Blastoise]